MAVSIGFDIFAHDRASKTFDKIGSSMGKLGGLAGKAGKAAAVALGGAAVAGVTALGAAMVLGVKDAVAYQTLAAKTAAVLKSTGNVAHQSVKGIQARAAALESMSGVDETVIINGQNVLATFTKIRDGVGKGNDIFNQATTAALNLSSALGTDLQGANILVGKALNDPIKGITALTRAGVTFTAQQKDQIKAMVASGDTMGAQKLILKELNTEFGGAAKAAGEGFAGSMARAKDAVGDAFRTIGTMFLPVLTKMADYVATHVGPVIKTFGDGIHAMAAAFQEGDVTSGGFVGFMERVGVAARDFIFEWKNGIGVAGAFRDAITNIAHAVGDFIHDFANGEGAAGKLRTALEQTGKAFEAVAKFIGQNLDLIVPLVGVVWGAEKAFWAITGVTKAWAAAQLLLNGTLILNPIGLVVAAIAVLVAAIIIAYKRSQTFRDIVSIAFNAVRLAVLQMALQAAIGFAGMVNAMLTAAAGIVHGAALAFGWVPGLGPKLKEADRKMTGFKDSVNATLGRVVKKLEISVATARAQTAAAILKKRLDDIKSKSVTIAVNYRVTAGRIWDGKNWVNVGLRASGGPVKKGHPYVVGEKGPELIYASGDATVVNAKDSAAIMAGQTGRPLGGGGGGDTYNISVYGVVGNPDQVMRAIQQGLLRLKRTGGTELGLA